MRWKKHRFYSDVIMDTMASQFTSLTNSLLNHLFSADQSKHQRSVSLGFVRGIHRWPVDSPHKLRVTRKLFPFDEVIVWNALVFINDGNKARDCFNRYAKGERWELFRKGCNYWDYWFEFQYPTQYIRTLNSNICYFSTWSCMNYGIISSHQCCIALRI